MEPEYQNLENTYIKTFFTNCRESLDQHVSVKRFLILFGYYEDLINLFYSPWGKFNSMIEKKESSNNQGLIFYA